ncbi:hypothetical protein BDP27DRAFT_1374902 [Rhodocollybia butyracea]|uniref:Uncharacterized protein n=1 Tax=Rhodocollybia butyracea TaxID=206335 RepID=A0A9P5P511_9AGAR|nr:hypothetical protein BDP27DRAFT_1374902 [Rhodocollybia butyracea]
MDRYPKDNNGQPSETKPEDNNMDVEMNVEMNAADVDIPPAVEQSQTTTTGRPKRQRYLPAAFWDYVPSQPNTLPPMVPDHTRYGSLPPAPPVVSSPVNPPSALHLQNYFLFLRWQMSQQNWMNLDCFPDEFISLDDYCDANTFYTAPAPARNPKICLQWQDSDGLAYIQRLNDEVIQQPDFDPKDLHGSALERKQNG